MFNVSAFDHVSPGDSPCQPVEAMGDWKVGVAAGVPLLVLLVALLALVKQNLQALQGVVDSVDRLLERLRGFMAPDRATEGDVEMGPVSHCPPPRRPRNQTDDEILRRGAQETQVWI